MTNEELERAASNLKGLARDLERFDPWSGTRSKSDAADLRAILSERAELLAAVERMRVALKRIAQPEYGIGFNRLRGIARAALTTGEGK